MSRMLFVNLPVSDVKASEGFFRHLGFDFNREYCDEHTLCMVIADNIFVMLLEEQVFMTFINGEVADATKVKEVLNCLSAESKAEIDDIVGKAIEAGAKPWKDPMEEGSMYAASFQDLDGHVWELMYMDQPA